MQLTKRSLRSTPHIPMSHRLEPPRCRGSFDSSLKYAAIPLVVSQLTIAASRLGKIGWFAGIVRSCIYLFLGLILMVLVKTSISWSERHLFPLCCLCFSSCSIHCSACDRYALYGQR